MKTKSTPATKYSSAVAEELLSEVTPLEMQKTRERMKLAARIADLIESKKFKNNAEFAKHLNRQPSEISKWLSGTHNFTIDTLCEISSALGVDLNALFVQKPIQVVCRYHVVISTESWPPPPIKYLTPELESIDADYLLTSNPFFPKASLARA